MMLADPNSSVNRFGCGNKETLSKPDTREVLLHFHKKWYSSNIMSVAFCSKSPIADLEKWAQEKFSPVVNNNVVIPDYGPLPYNATNS